MPGQFILHLLLGAAVEYFIRLVIARIDILQRQVMIHRTGSDVARPLHAFNGGRLHVDILIVLVVNQVLDFVTVGGETPVKRPGYALQAGFPLLRLFRFQVWVSGDAGTIRRGKARCAELLAQRRRQETRAIGERRAIAIDKLPARGGLPGTVPAELLIVILTSGRFQRHRVNLLLPGQVQPGGITFVSIRESCTAGRQLLLLPVHAAANRPVPDFNVITPLDIALLHIIQRSVTRIATEIVTVVVILQTLVVGDQLRRVDTGIVAQAGVPGLVVALTFVIATRIAV